MFVLKNLILALATVLDWAIMIYIWIVIIRALISWVEPNPYNPIVRFLHAVTEPLLERKLTTAIRRSEGSGQKDC
jgi:YggT family protein